MTQPSFPPYFLSSLSHKTRAVKSNKVIMFSLFLLVYELKFLLMTVLFIFCVQKRGYRKKFLNRLHFFAVKQNLILFFLRSSSPHLPFLSSFSPLWSRNWKLSSSWNIFLASDSRHKGGRDERPGWFWGLSKTKIPKSEKKPWLIFLFVFWSQQK